MAFSFSVTTTDWVPAWEPVAMFAKEVPNKTIAPDGKVYLKRKMIYMIWRYGYGVISGSSEIGTVNTGGFAAVNGPFNISGGSGKNYRCTLDNVEPDPAGSGIWKQSQRWEYETDWKLVDNDTV